MSTISPPNHVAPSKKRRSERYKDYGSEGKGLRDGFIDAKSLRQFGQVDFLPMFIMCYYEEDVLKRFGSSVTDVEAGAMYDMVAK